MEVRSATIDDAVAVADLYLQSAKHHVALDPDFYHVPDRAPVVNHYTERLRYEDPNSSVILVAVDGEQVLGMAEVQVGELPPANSMVAPQRPATVAVVVDERHRGRGIGSELISRAESWAGERSVDLIMLDLRAHNREAVSLYHRLGYRDHGSLLTKRRTAS